METLFSELRSRTGAEYVAGRDRLLGGSAEEVRAFLVGKRQAADDPVEQLCLEALIHRTNHPGEFQAAWAQAVQAGTRGIVTRAGDVDEGPWPGLAGYTFVQVMGPPAGAYAAELLTKDLLRDDPPWQRDALVSVLRFFGRVPAQHVAVQGATARQQQKYPPEDPRMGWALLRFRELYSHEEDERSSLMKANLGVAFRGFASPELLASARAARDRAHDEPRKERLSRAVKTIESELHDMERRKAAGHPAAATTATAPAGSQEPAIKHTPTFDKSG